jgi:hypothetical protein
VKTAAHSISGVLVTWSLLLPLLLSCVPPEFLPTPHENFKTIMQNNVGKRADDPTSHVSRFPPEWVIGSRLLPNGNIETEYARREACRVFFEINPKTRIIVGWRFEGSERDCEIVP